MPHVQNPKPFVWTLFSTVGVAVYNRRLQALRNIHRVTHSQFHCTRANSDYPLAAGRIDDLTGLWMVNRKFTTMACLLLLLPGTAYAYVDPGTGAYLLQTLVAVFGAVVFYCARPKELFRLIRAYFTKKTKD